MGTEESVLACELKHHSHDFIHVKLAAIQLQSQIQTAWTVVDRHNSIPPVLN